MSNDYLDHYVFDIICDEFDETNMNYLIDSLTKIRDKDRAFVNKICVRQYLNQLYRDYKSRPKNDFQSMYTNLNFAEFVKAYTANFETYHKALNYDDMTTFDWVSEFRNPGNE